MNTRQTIGILALSLTFTSTSLAQVGTWSTSVGTMTRQIDTNVRLPAPSFNPFDHLRRQSSTSINPLPFFTFADDGTLLSYDSGFIGPNAYPEDGDADATAHGSQMSDSGRFYFAGGEELVYIYDVRFSSPGGTQFGYGQNGGFNAVSAGGADDANGVFLNARYGLRVLDIGIVNILTGWTISSAGQSRNLNQGSLSVFETRTTSTHQYRYDGVEPLLEPEGPPPTFEENDGIVVPPPPPLPDAVLEGFVILDPAIAGGDPDNYYGVPLRVPNPFLAPDQSTTTETTASTIAVFEARSGVDLDLNLHEFPLALEFGVSAADAVEFTVAAGPTLNILNADFDAWQTILQQGSTDPIVQNAWSNSDTHILPGFMTQASVLWNFSPKRGAFAEVYGGYRWIESVDLQAGPASVTIDPSSYEAGVGVGIRL